MAKLLGGTTIYGNATVNSYLIVSGNADLSGGNVSIGSGNTTVTSITATAYGNGYQSSPTATISSPTTLYGATATANVSIGVVAIAANINGGTGYAVNNVLTAVGNASVVSNATFTVTSVSGGVITGLSVTTPGTYYFANTNPITFTGGSGSGANAFVYYGINTPVMTYNGIGYTEPAAVTLSGGSPSVPATVFPVVGTTQSTVNILGGTLSFKAPGGELVRFVDQGSYSSAGVFYNPLLITRVNSQNATYIQAQGQNLRISATSGGAIYFDTGVGSETALLIPRTVNAVNYLQATGATTTNAPTISAQGSDTNISLQLQGKGSGNVFVPNILVSGVQGGSGYLLLNGVSTTSPQITLNAPGSGPWGTLGALGIQSPSTVSYWGLGWNSSAGTQSVAQQTLTWSSNGVVILPQTVSSTSTTTGALQVAGGAGIAGNVYVGGNINLTAQLTNIATTANTGTLSVGGNISYGPDYGLAGSFVSNIAGYNYVAVQNLSATGNASASFTAYNDTGTSYVDVGVNSSQFNAVASGFVNNSVNKPNASYAYAYGGDMVIGTWGNNALHFITNASSTVGDSMFISGNGNVYISGNLTVSGNTTQITTITTIVTETANAIQVSYLSGNSSVNSGNITVSSPLVSNSSMTAPTHIATNGLIVTNANINTSYTSPAGMNMLSVGPVTVASNVTVTVATGQRWLVL